MDYVKQSKKLIALGWTYTGITLMWTSGLLTNKQFNHLVGIHDAAEAQLAMEDM